MLSGQLKSYMCDNFYILFTITRLGIHFKSYLYYFIHVYNVSYFFLILALKIRVM